MTVEDDPGANPIGTELVYEDEEVRVWRIRLEPGGEAPWHIHRLQYTTVAVSPGELERENDDGSVDRMRIAPGDLMRWHEGSLRHMVRNVGSTPFSNVIVELKGTSTGA